MIRIRNKKLQKIITYFITLALVVTQFFVADFGFTITSHAASSSMANVVIFVDFQDTDHRTHEKDYVGECFLHNPQTTFDLFDGSDTKITGMAQYLDTISYGQLKLVNIFPQYDENANTITPFTVSKNASEYLDRDSSTLLSEVLSQLDSSGLLTEDADLNDDGGIYTTGDQHRGALYQP